MIETTMYLHGSDDQNWETAHELGLSEEASRKFAYTCYEVEVQLQVDPETGIAMATHFCGVKLAQPVEV